MLDNKIRLTQYSHGAGCGCKIAPAVLETILKTDFVAPTDSNLLVGNSTKDDAAGHCLRGRMDGVPTMPSSIGVRCYFLREGAKKKIGGKSTRFDR